METLKELREAWEAGSDVFATKGSEEEGQLEVLLGDGGGDNRRVLRYFTIGSKWHVSVDIAPMTADNMLIEVLGMQQAI